LAWSAQEEERRGESRGRGGLAWLGRFGCWSAQLGRPPFFCFLFFLYLFLSFKNAFGVPKLFRKMEMRYRWIPCEKIFTMEPTLKQNKIFYKTKFA
jgi:hypothetical protein